MSYNTGNASSQILNGMGAHPSTGERGRTQNGLGRPRHGLDPVRSGVSIHSIIESSVAPMRNDSGRDTRAIPNAEEM